MSALRPCLDCGAITATSRCPGCTSARGKVRDRQRGTRQQRGYDAAHEADRRGWTPAVAAGHVACWRCGDPIQPGEPWDLGHDDRDRTVTRGPEHANRCNRKAGGQASHA